MDNSTCSFCQDLEITKANNDKLNEELKKPVKEIDFDLVHECILTIDYLKKD